MKEVFTNANHLTCIFTDKGILFSGAKQEAYYPYGCVDSLKMSLLGILQVVHRNQIMTFAVYHQDRSRMKQMMKDTKSLIENGGFAEPCIFEKRDLVAEDLSAEEQLKQYKGLYVQGVISKEEYDVKKVILSL